MVKHSGAKAATSRGAGGPTCWDCRAPVGAAHFCPACGKIQPLPPATDYFGFFGLPRRLGLDAAALDRQYHHLSWQLTLSNYQPISTYEQELLRDQTRTLEEAYSALRAPLSRAEYLLRLENNRPESEARPGSPLADELYAVNELLEDLREARQSDSRQLEELRHRLEKMRHQLQEQLEAVETELRQQFLRWDASAGQDGAAAARAAVLQALGEVAGRNQVLSKLLARVNDELAE